MRGWLSGNLVVCCVAATEFASVLLLNSADPLYFTVMSLKGDVNLYSGAFERVTEG